MTNLFRMKVQRLIEAMKGYNVDVLVLRSRKALSYLFSEIYYPLPEGLPALAVVIDVWSGNVKVYTSTLEFFRIEEVYGIHDFVDVVPVIKHTAELELGKPAITDLKTEIRKLTSRKSIVGIDDHSSREFLRDVDLVVDVSRVITKLRRTKMELELEHIRQAIDLTEKALQRVSSEISRGMNELQIASLFEHKARELGAEGFAFPTIVAIGPNAAKPHHMPNPRTTYTGREPILIDCGVRVRGYVADITRMLIPAKLGNEYEEVLGFIDVISVTIDKVLKVLWAGVNTKELYEIARNALNEAGRLDRFFIHGLGHGIGVDVHEEPYLAAHYEDQLLENEVVTVEPGIYVKGKLGVRIEEDVLITSHHNVVLTHIPRVIAI